MRILLSVLVAGVVFIIPAGHAKPGFQRRRMLWFKNSAGLAPKFWTIVKDVIAVQRGRFDWPYIERWCDAHGTRARLEEIRASIPDF